MTTPGSELAVVAPKSIAEWQSFAKTVSLAQTIPQALKKKPEDILVIGMTGAELGLGPMASIRGIHIINGKPTLSADTMGGLVMSNGVCEYLTLIESTNEIATYETKRRGSPAPVRLSFTIKQARAAGLTSNATYAKYPDAMLRARCLAAICRAVYPDLCAGLYDSDSGEIVESEVTARSEPTPTAQATHAAQVAAALKSQVAPAKIEDIVDAEVVETDATPEADEPGASDGIDETVADLKAKIEAATGLDTLQAIAKTIPATLPDDVKIVLREAYFARRTALVGGAS